MRALFLLVSLALAGFVVWLFAANTDGESLERVGADVVSSRLPSSRVEPAEPETVLAPPETSRSHSSVDDATAARAAEPRETTPAPRSTAYGVLAGAVRVPFGANRALLRVEVVHERRDDGGRLAGSLERALDADGEFTFDGLVDPGAWCVNVLGGGGVLASVSGVEVVGGRDADDRRLHPIDLAAELCVVRVEFVDEHDARIEDGWLALHRSGATGLDWAARGADGRFEFLVPIAGLDVLAGAPGRATVARRALNADARIVLPPAHRLTLTAAGTEPLAQDDLRIGVLYELVAAPEGWPDGFAEIGWRFFDDERHVALELAAPGRYRVQWVFATNWTGAEPDAVGDLSDALPPPVELEVGASGGLERALVPPAGLMERVKRRLGR